MGVLNKLNISNIRKMLTAIIWKWSVIYVLLVCIQWLVGEWFQEASGTLKVKLTAKTENLWVLDSKQIAIVAHSLYDT